MNDSNTSVTLWDRLEPITRDASLEDTLHARTADPLWMLARQWQLGEFRGEDAGSPVDARIDVQSDNLARFRLGDPGSGDRDGQFGGQDYDKQPLEVVVEREGVVEQEAGSTESSGENLVRAVEAGMMLLQLLDFQVDPSGFKTEYRIRSLDEHGEGIEPETRRYLRVTGGIAVDGTKVYKELIGESNSLGDILKGDYRSLDLSGVETKYQNWYENLFSRPKRTSSSSETDTVGDPSASPRAWNNSRFEYSFSLETSNCLELQAPEYLGGDLDWFDFSVSGSALQSEITEERVIPTPVQFAGMPAPRFWEFEEGDVDFASITAAPEDLSRLVFLEFALGYGNDWFSLPVAVPFGALASITKLKVTDTFGEKTEIKRVDSRLEEDSSSERWQMFRLSVDGTENNRPKEGLEGGLFLPPVLVDSLESEDPIEEVALVRDEMVNAAWAVELVVSGRMGQRVRRSEQTNEEEGNEDTSKLPTWILATDIPEYWYPFLPKSTESDSTTDNRLHAGSVLDKGRKDTPPKGVVLKPYVGDSSSSSGEKSGSFIYEEEIPREGTKLERYTQLAGWLDGSMYLWRARRKEVGRGERSSGLRFDALTEPESTGSQESD